MCDSDRNPMKWAQRQRAKSFLIVLIVLVTLAIFLGWLSRKGGDRSVLTWSRSSTAVPPPVISSSPSVYVAPSSDLSPSIDSPDIQSSPSPFIHTSGLIIPVAGVRADQLLDTFSAARGDGRVHDAIDIP